MAFRRSAILATISVLYLVSGEKPTRSDTVSASLVTLGAFLASAADLEQSLLGTILTWGNNFSQSLQNLYISKLNESKLLSPFGKSSFDVYLTCHDCYRDQLLFRNGGPSP